MFKKLLGVCIVVGLSCLAANDRPARAEEQQPVGRRERHCKTTTRP